VIYNAPGNAPEARTGEERLRDKGKWPLALFDAR